MTIGTRTAKGTGRTITKQGLVVLSGAVLIVAALATFGAHSLGQHGGTAAEGRAVARSVSASLSGTGSGPPPGLTLYLSGSAAQADQATSALRDENTALFENGAPDRQAAVNLVTSAAEAAQIRDAATTLNAVLAENGIGPITIVDLGPATGTAAAPVTPADPVQPR